jgi:hypothetical protein
MLSRQASTLDQIDVTLEKAGDNFNIMPTKGLVLFLSTQVASPPFHHLEFLLKFEYGMNYFQQFYLAEW